jgi:hypothetical protein
MRVHLLVHLPRRRGERWIGNTCASNAADDCLKRVNCLSVHFFERPHVRGHRMFTPNLECLTVAGMALGAVRHHGCGATAMTLHILR